LENIDKKIALVLGSGAARSLAHIGVLKVLEEAQIKPEIVVGTSMGALIAGGYAAGLSAKEMEDIACKTNWLRVAQLLMPRKLQRDGLIDGVRIEEFIIALLGEQKIENLNIPFAAVATDLLTGEEVILQSGSLVKAIRASISLPFLFSPVKINGQLLVDGAVTNPLPINVAREMGGKFVIAVQTTPAIDYHIRQLNSGAMTTNRVKKAAKSANTFLKRFLKYLNNGFTKGQKRSQDETQLNVTPGLRHNAMQAATIMENMLLYYRLKDNPADLLIKPGVDSFGFFNFTQGEEIIQAGEMAALKAIKELSIC